MKLHIVILAMSCGACSQVPVPASPESQVERKMIGLMQKFDLWDDNGDGQLDEAELAIGLEGMEHKPAAVIDFYDTNRNRKISLREAQAGYSRSEEAEQRIQVRRAAEGGAR